MPRKYSESKLTKAVLLVIEGGMSPKQVAKETGINLRAIQRYKNLYVGEMSTPEPPSEGKQVALSGTISLPSADVIQELDSTILARTQYLNEIFETKKVILARIKKISNKSPNLDALQRSLKTLSEIEGLVAPQKDNPTTPGVVNIFQVLNQQLSNNGYKGPELTDADIVKGD